MRYSQSGHQKRRDELAAKRLARIAAPGARARIFVVIGAAVAPAVLGLALSTRTRLVMEETVHRVIPTMVMATPTPTPMPLPAAPPPPPPDPTVRDVLRANEALSQALARNGIGADDVSDLVRSLKGVLEVRSLRAGARFSVREDEGQLARFTFHALSAEGVPRLIVAERIADAANDTADNGVNVEGGATEKKERAPRFRVQHEDAPIEVAIEGLTGTIKGSLYNGVLDAGGDANLVNKFVDVFAWNIDFYRQTRTGDEWKVLVEKKYAGQGEDRRFLGWGKVVAAEYINAGHALRGFAFESKDGKFAGIFDELGDALERTFLKNPMEVSRVTSNYGMRFHPVLGRNKAHEGVDYGAAIGTPVWTVADGTVVDARFSSSAGNMVLIQHMNGITTEYFHLSRFADGLKKGDRVRQKQLIGYVGSTGLSTGPHLHFGMLRSGGHVDPSKQKFPNAKPVPNDYRAEFDAVFEPLQAQLQSLTRS